VSNHIIFLTKTTTGKSGLLLVNSELGNYEVILHPSLNYEPGEMVNFICHICYENLDAEEYDKNLAKVIMQDETGKESVVVFSKITGQKCTFHIDEKQVRAFGNDKEEYNSTFGEIF